MLSIPTFEERLALMLQLDQGVTPDALLEEELAGAQEQLEERVQELAAPVFELAGKVDEDLAARTAAIPVGNIYPVAEEQLEALDDTSEDLQKDIAEQARLLKLAEQDLAVQKKSRAVLLQLVESYRQGLRSQKRRLPVPDQFLAQTNQRMQQALGAKDSTNGIRS